MKRESLTQDGDRIKRLEGWQAYWQSGSTGEGREVNGLFVRRRASCWLFLLAAPNLCGANCMSGKSYIRWSEASSFMRLGQYCMSGKADSQYRGTSSLFKQGLYCMSGKADSSARPRPFLD
ncbi:hypothetical protein RRG08_043622 [Elysia crispata]|uniref:Uncharacterized protein n=1 Tax=Elysia crispata TaxID=231223 RepID=A0AAE1A5R9_9GAST|nr:hypothetical protein RRG08_043622 [Elysia crispata]